MTRRPRLRLRTLSILFGMLATMLAAFSGPATGAPADPTPSRPASTSQATSERTDTAATRVLIAHVRGGATQVRSAVRAAVADGLRVRHTFAGQQSFSVQVGSAQAPDQAQAQIAALPAVTAVEKGVTRRFLDAPNDPKIDQQSTYLDAVNAPEAWQQQTGSPTVKIAVLDSGVDVGHPDLAGKIAATYNAHNHGTSITDSVGHGTFVAGVAAADTDNGVGIAGAGYDSRILAVKVADRYGDVSVDDEIAGIRWAVEHGADVINLSLGGLSSSRAEGDAVAYAQSKGVVVVAAAGNDGDTVKEYPAAYPGVVSVAATDPGRQARAPFSDHGSWITLAAPGVQIYSTTPRSGSLYFPTHRGYAYADGTSFAAPLVAGEAALVKAANPASTVTQVRDALVRSAHGYGQLGLGAGQADFALALRHTAPSTPPTQVRESGRQNIVTLSARTSAPAVAFTVDGGTPLPPVQAVDGTAKLSWPSWGYADGRHIVTATDCTEFGECATVGTSAPFALTSDLGVVNRPPAGTTATGRFTVTASRNGGGGLRLLVGGKPVGFDADSPYSFSVDGTSIPDGRQTLQVQLCSTSGVRCDGPVSAGRDVIAASLHPRVDSLTPAAISPNADGVQDTASLSFTLPDTEKVVAEVTSPTGGVVRYARLGTLKAGTHTWTWRGEADSGSPLPDQSYRVGVSTSREVDGFIQRGAASVPAVLDTQAPSLAPPTGDGITFYPARDHYRDRFTTNTEIGQAATVTFTARNSLGHVVRTITTAHQAGPVTVQWGGLRDDDRLVSAGRFAWTLSATDAAGNSTHSSTRHLFVSAKQLRHVTSVVRLGATKFGRRDGTASCAYATHTGSQFPDGLRMVNTCRAASYDFAYATYRLTLPRAQSYQRLSMLVYGHSRHRPSQLSVSIQRTDGALEVPGSLKVSKRGNAWRTIASVPAAVHVAAHRHVYLTIILDSRYPGLNDFDLGAVAVRVTNVALR